MTRSGSIEKITEVEIAQYLAMKAAKKLKSKTVNGYTNDSNVFVWRKKIERDVTQGVPLNMFSVKSEKKKHKERTSEFENLKKRREQKAIEKATLEEQIALLARNRARAQTEFNQEEVFDCDQTIAPSHENRIKPVDLLSYNENELRKPKYVHQVHTGYEWNKYNRIHYDHDHPPPKMVQGYKFDIFYPDLIDKTNVPVYTIEKNGDSVETCIIRFHAGPPYEDIEFNIVNEEWEYSHKKGFKCTFENGTMHLYFNFKRYRYRR